MPRRLVLWRVVVGEIPVVVGKVPVSADHLTGGESGGSYFDEILADDEGSDWGLQARLLNPLAQLAVWIRLVASSVKIWSDRLTRLR
jgi:hypothetical protein